MTKLEFIEKLQEELEFDEQIDFDTDFKQLEEWDSMSAMVLLGFVSNNFGLSLTAPDLASLNTIDSLIEFISVQQNYDFK